MRAEGVEVEVVSPASFRHFGIAYGHGIAGNLRARPWLVLLLPRFSSSFARAARRAARDADLVHAHWLPSALAALATGKPFVVQLWGTDVELARRVPWLARPSCGGRGSRSRASEFLADAARELGAREVRVIPSGVEIPETVGEPDEPPHVLFVGRLSPGEGHPRVPRGGGGPAARRRRRRAAARPRSRGGRVRPARASSAPYYERAAVVCVPSRREGYGVVAREAMAHGRPVVATAVGGLVDVVDDGVTGLLVPPGDVRSLRAALERLLADPELRARLGAAAREHAKRNFAPEAAAAALLEVLPLARLLEHCADLERKEPASERPQVEALQRHHMRSGSRPDFSRGERQCVLDELDRVPGPLRTP